MRERVKYQNATYIENPFNDETSKFYHNGQPYNVLNVNASLLKKDPDFPVAKYIVVTKVRETKYKFMLQGKYNKPKLYGIGILTTKNRYYFTQLYTRKMELSSTIINELKEIFSRPYVITPETKIVFSDNVDRKYDPVWLFLSIIGSVVGIRIHVRSYIQQLKRINSLLHYVKCKKGYASFNTNQHVGKLMKKLFKYDRFDFIPDPYFKERLNDGTKYERDMKIKCAVGILYMDCVSRMDKNVKNSILRNKLRLGSENIEKQDPIYRKPE